MLRLLTGIAFGYFIYTKDGRQAIKDSLHMINKSINQVNNLFATEDSKEDKEHGHSKVHTWTDDGRID